VHNPGRREAVEGRATGSAISAHVLGVDQLADLQIRELLGQADGIEGVASGAKDGTDLRGTLLEASNKVDGVVENHAAISVIDTVVEIVAKPAAADSLTDDLGDGGDG
jgi:hypothetical protein